jgi:hypothetical protein
LNFLVLLGTLFSVKSSQFNSHLEVASMKWFKLWSEARNDAKLRVLSCEDRWIWFSLLCYASEQEERGVIRHPARLVAAEVCNGDIAKLATTCNELVALELIKFATCDDQSIEITFPSFAYRQSKSPSDDPAEINKRSQRYRSKRVKPKKHATSLQRVCNEFATNCNEFATNCNDKQITDTDSETESEKSVAVDAYTRPKTSTHPPESKTEPERPKNSVLVADPSTGWVDRLSAQVADWFPGSGFDADVYGFFQAATYGPEAIEWGFAEAYKLALRGEGMMTIKRIKGLIRYAEDHGLSTQVKRNFTAAKRETRQERLARESREHRAADWSFLDEFEDQLRACQNLAV